MRGPRTLKNAVWCRCVRRFIVYENQWRQGAENTLFLFYLRALGVFHPLILDILRPRLARGPKALKNTYGGVWVCVRRLKPMKTGSGKHVVLHVKSLGALHPLMVDKLRARCARGPVNREAIGHSLLRLCL
jgi:hypothetical protein